VVLKTISKETGYTSEELHEFFKRIFLKKEIVIGGKVYETSISTRKLKKDQFSEYIEKIKGFVFLRLDLVIPEAGEYEPDGFIVDEDIDEIKIEDIPFL
jgi:nicotinamide mononucleotide adenylyltransferase